MARRIPEVELAAIVEAVAKSGEATAQQLARAFGTRIPLRTLQYRLQQLVATQRLIKEGKGPAAKYSLFAETGNLKVIGGEARIDAQSDLFVPVSKRGAEIQRYLRRPPALRKPVGYERKFLDSYRPGVTSYLSNKEKQHLLGVGSQIQSDQAAGTYAKQILGRLLIDLSWNSSRLEGNTYSLLDTKRLIEFGQEAEGHEHLEAQMILNHKDAIEFLVGSAEEIGFNRYTILNLHGILANNLLADPGAAGRLRHIGVGIERSVFHPLELPQLIEECFDQILALASAVEDPFEQAFFVSAQLPYLQPFDDVNKRVSRLAANIPLIRGNLAPLSFIDVPRSTYAEAMMGIYELNKVDLLKDVFIWAYERSAARYAAVRQSLGEPDPFRLKHRARLREVVTEVVHRRLDKKKAVTFVESWAQKNIELAEQEKFREIAENELLGLHEGNFARYQLKPSEFKAWQAIWTARVTAE